MKEPLPSTRVTPIHFVGDSNTLIYHDLLIDRHPSESGQTILRTSYCGALHAAQFMSQDGELAPIALYALLTSGVLVGDAKSWSREKRDAILNYFSERVDFAGDRWGSERRSSFLRPIVVFCIGSLDFWTILGKLGVSADFYFDSSRLAGLHFPKRDDGLVVPMALVRELIERAFSPLFRGLEAIRNSGVTNVFLHELQPPSLDLDEFTRMVGSYPIDLRYKLTIAINERLARFCRESKLGFIEIWDEVTAPDGLLDEKFALDYGHLNRHAASITIQRLFSLLGNRSGS